MGKLCERRPRRDDLLNIDSISDFNSGNFCPFQEISNPKLIFDFPL